MYHHPRRLRRNRGRSKAGYIFPFLILVGLIVVVILIFNFIRLMFSPSAAAGASVHLVNGDVQLKVWGTEDFFALRSDTMVRPGDRLVTGNGAKVIVEFFDGTLVRLGESSDVVFEVMEEGEDPVVELLLARGELWVNRVYKNTEGTALKVKMSDVAVLAEKASVFALQSDTSSQVVRVLNSFDDRSGALVEVYDTDFEDVLETEEVSIAQEVEFDAKILAGYRDFKSPTVLKGLAAEFQDSDWYDWNLKEDRNPTQFEIVVGGTENVGLIPVEEETRELENEEASEEEDLDKEELVEEIEDSGTFAAPKLVSVSGGAANAEGVYVVANNPAVISGTVSGANQIVVNGYALQKFTPGSGAWTYYANADFGLMKEGENVFEVYAVDTAGKKSGLLNFKVLYQPVKEQVISDNLEVTSEEEVGN